jgi:hypothetical protein
MMDALWHFFEVIRPHLPLVTLAFTWAGIAYVAWRRRGQWRRKQFLAQVNFSLNYVAGNDLAMRTLLETTAGQVWLNDYGVRLVLAAARKVSVGQPFLVLPDAKDQEFVVRAALNALSERFAEAYLAASLGLPVRTASYVFGISCEKYGEIRTLKVRVLLIAEQTLNDLFGPAGRANDLRPSAPHLQARLQTLRILYDLYLKDKGSDHPVLGRAELGVLP